MMSCTKINKLLVALLVLTKIIHNKRLIIIASTNNVNKLVVLFLFPKINE